MNTPVSAFPLHWPVGWRRMHHSDRRSARFGRRAQGVSISEAVGRVQNELRRIGARDGAIISTDLELRKDGLPYSSQREPKDPGVAVYWQVGKETRCMAVDYYDRIADNIAAIAATLEAMRAIERHGGAEILERAFTGFNMLPAPEQRRWWWEVLGVDQKAGHAEVEAAYLKLRSQKHPDRDGGSETEFHEVQQAWEAYLAESGR